MNIIVFHGEAVVETNELANMYYTTPDDITKAYTQNQHRFREGIHYYIIDDRFKDFELFKKEYLAEECAQYQRVYMWTDQGLYEHALIMNRMLAWYVYCQFIYFVYKQSEELEQGIQLLQLPIFEDFITKERFESLVVKGVF